MQNVFKNKVYFTILFFALLIIDIAVKMSVEAIPYRYFTKPLIVGSLIIYYFLNRRRPLHKKHKFMVLALLSFIVGDIMFIQYKIVALYIFALLLFVSGKLFYTIRFSNQRDFNLIRLWPFFISCFIYMVIIMFLVMDNLKEFLIPTMIYLFASMIVILFSILRKNAVNYKSYVLVLIGVISSVFSDSISVLQSFYNPDFPFHEPAIMLFYGISQYFIVTGIVEEVLVQEMTTAS